jgi:hypothetical protein
VRRYGDSWLRTGSVRIRAGKQARARAQRRRQDGPRLRHRARCHRAGLGRRSARAHVGGAGHPRPVSSRSNSCSSSGQVRRGGVGHQSRPCVQHHHHPQCGSESALAEFQQCLARAPKQRFEEHSGPSPAQRSQLTRQREDHVESASTPRVPATVTSAPGNVKDPDLRAPAPPWVCSTSVLAPVSAPLTAFACAEPPPKRYLVRLPQSL